MGILTWLEYLPAYSARERQGRGAVEWQDVKRSIEKHLDNNEEIAKVLSWHMSAIKLRGSSGRLFVRN